MDVKNCLDSRPSISKRKTSVSLKKAVTDTHSAEQPCQFDPRQYRMLAHCFSSNINLYYGKKMRNLLGELEEWYKIPLTREEKQALDQNLHALLDKNIARLVRDSLNRNSNIHKNINDYAQQYQKNLKNIDNEDGFAVNQTIELDDKQKSSLKNCKSPTKNRPFSSHRMATRRISQLNAQNPQIILRNRTGEIIFQKDDQVNVEPQCYVYIRENCRKGGRSKMGSKYRISGYEKLGLLDEFRNSGMQLMQNNSEVIETGTSSYGNEKARRTSLLWRNKDRENEYHIGFDSKSITKTNLNKFFNPSVNNTTPKPRPWDQVQKQKIKNKILSANGCLSANIAQSQGYRPKSKCWGTTVSNFGKLLAGPAKQPVQGSKFLSTMLRYKQ